MCDLEGHRYQANFTSTFRSPVLMWKQLFQRWFLANLCFTVEQLCNFYSKSANVDLSVRAVLLASVSEHRYLKEAVRQAWSKVMS